MSLLTPPRTGHRSNKENRETDPSCRVIFSDAHKIHILSSPSQPTATSATIEVGLAALKVLPGRPILKKSHRVFTMPFDEEEPQREVTPEPADPLCDLVYLEYPVSVISRGEKVSLRELIEAYSVLTARLRSCVTGTTDVDASWPLFQPLRKNRDAFVAAVVRDLGKALVDPAVSRAAEKEKAERFLLPSPTNTPKKKRDGMTAEEVKRARDLCSTSHAVIRLLALVFTLPAVWGVFSDCDLRSMLTAVLAIPLEDNLPTLNARKTCALAIWLIQTQRLPDTVLGPAADRVAFALARGIDGELGKEGKKGAASDGLKAIHDLSIHAPLIFIPAFTHAVLPSVLANILAPTLALRTLACHALGGFVLGTLEVPRGTIHADISEIVTEWFMRVPPPPKPSLMSPTKSSPTKTAPANVAPAKSPSSPAKPGTTTATPTSPSKATIDPPIVRTLRTTLQGTDPAHVAHGPVWALLVIASLLVLMGNRVARDGKVGRVVNGLVSLAMRHRRSAVRGLACLVWRGVAWCFCQPRVGSEKDKDQGEEKKERSRERERKARDQWWDLLVSVPELEMGVCTVVALVGGARGCSDWVQSEVDADDDEGGWVVEGRKEALLMQKVLQVLKIMSEKDGPTTGQALDVLKSLLGVAPTSTFEDASDEDKKPSLLPRSLFSALPGLLSADYKCLGSAVNPLFEETPKAEHVRPLRWEEIACPGVWRGLVGVWRKVLGCVDIWELEVKGVNKKSRKGKDVQEEGEVWADLVGVWEGLVKGGVGALGDEGADDTLGEFATTTVDVIVDSILQDESLDMVPKRELPSLTASYNTLPSSGPSAGNTIKLRFAKALWNVLRDVFPQAGLLSKGSEKLLACLMKNSSDYTTLASNANQNESEAEQSANELWTEFCVDVLAVCGTDGVRAFWGYPDLETGERVWVWKWTGEERRSVWNVFCQNWMELEARGEGEWEGAGVLLGVPFLYETAWELSKPDTDIWNALLDYAINKSLDFGYDTSTVLGYLASNVSKANQAAPTAAPACVQLVEFLLTRLANAAGEDGEEEVREVPESVVELVSETMGAAYPPAPREKTRYLWAARALGDVIGKCPKGEETGEGALVDVLRGVVDGVVAWVEDEMACWSLEELEYDIVPLYQNILLRIQELPLSMDLLRTFASFIGCPFSGREAVCNMSTEIFREYWQATYAQLEQPEEGWPEEVQMAVETVFGPAVTIEEGDEEIPRPTTPTPVASASLALAATSTIAPATSTVPTSRAAFKLVPASWSPDICPDSESPSGGWTVTRPTTPTTPTKGSLRLSLASSSTVIVTPPRPHKPPVGSFNFLTQLPLLKSPGSPIRHATPRKTPRCVIGASSVKRRRVEFEEDNNNKENKDPQGQNQLGRIRSVAERIEEVYGTPRTLGKRRSSFGRDDDGEAGAGRPSPMKKGKMVVREEEVVPETEDEEDEKDVEAALVRKPTEEEEDVFGGKTTTPAPKPAPVSLPNFMTMRDAPILTPTQAPTQLAPLPKEDGEQQQPQPQQQPSRKRKRMIMEAVEVPDLKEVYGGRVTRPSALRVSISFSSAQKKKVPLSPGIARRTRSATKAPSTPTSTGRSPRDAGLKWRKQASTPNNLNGAAEVTASPALGGVGEAPSSDPIIIKPRVVGRSAVQEQQEHAVSSSDDDPHLGQVTPHHLISPEMKHGRAGRFSRGDVFGSDESVPSPSNDMVQRRMKRMGSAKGGSLKGKPPLKRLVF